MNYVLIAGATTVLTERDQIAIGQTWDHALMSKKALES
jgi:hypothetical protein